MATAMKILQLKITQLRTDGGTQIRVNTSQERIDEYAECMEAGARFPAVIAFFDGAHYWLADGFHRLFALLKLGHKTIEVDVRAGTQRDAILYATGPANKTHGMRLTEDDHRARVRALLMDSEWSRWPNERVQQHTGAGEWIVRDVRYDIMAEQAKVAGKNGEPLTREVTGKDGKTYKVKVQKPQQPSQRQVRSVSHTPEPDAKSVSHTVEVAPSPTLTTCPACGHQWED